MAVHTEQVPGAGRPVLIAVVTAALQVVTALAEGADLVDLSAANPGARAEISVRWPAAVWTGRPPDPLDADRLPGTGADGLAAAVAIAAIGTWLGVPAIRTRHVRAVRRAIDMSASVAGTRLPTRTLRGLG